VTAAIKGNTASCLKQRTFDGVEGLSLVVLEDALTRRVEVGDEGVDRILRIRQGRHPG